MSTSTDDEPGLERETFEKSLPYRVFKQRNPAYCADRWAEYRALYEGGEKLDYGSPEGEAMLKKLLPQHVGEEDDVYQKRLEFALYIPYAGQIVDFIVAALGSDPITMQAEPELDDWYDEFYKNTSAPGGCKQPFEDLLRQQLLTALLCRRSWLLVDLPKVFDAETRASSLAEQEEAGALDAYLVPVEPENLIDWEETDDGLLKFAIVCRRTQVRDGLRGARDHIREEYTYFTASQWARYAIEWDTAQKQAPDDEDPVMLEDEGDHAFGRVPLVSLDLTAGLHAMGKIAQMARSHFNKRSALDWGEYRSAFQFLAAKLGPEDSMQPVSADPNRAINQRIGHGRVMVLGGQDDIKYVSPDAAPFQIIMADLNGLRDEMHRVLHSMALSIDNSAAALQRSGSSKQQDMAAQGIVLKGLGKILREYAVEVYELVAIAHGDEDKYEIKAHGGEEFDAMSLQDFLEEMATLNEVDIPSETFQRKYKFKAAKLALGGGTDDDDLDAIRDELEKNISPEQFDPVAQAQALADATADIGKGEPDDEPDGEGDGGTSPLGAKPAKTPKAKAPKAKGAKAPKVKAKKPPASSKQAEE